MVPLVTACSQLAVNGTPVLQGNKQLLMLLHNKAAKLHVASCAPDALAAASANFARGADSAAFAAALAAAAKQAPSSERTLFSARAAMQVPSPSLNGSSRPGPDIAIIPL